MKKLLIIAAMLICMIANSQVNISIDQQLLIYNVDVPMPVYPTFNSYFCPQTQCWHEYNIPPPPIEISNNINIIYIDMDNPIDDDQIIDPIEGVIYNTTTPRTQ